MYNPLRIERLEQQIANLEPNTCFEVYLNGTHRAHVAVTGEVTPLLGKGKEPFTDEYHALVKEGVAVLLAHCSITEVELGLIKVKRLENCLARTLHLVSCGVNI